MITFRGLLDQAATSTLAVLLTTVVGVLACGGANRFPFGPPWSSKGLYWHYKSEAGEAIDLRKVAWACADDTDHYHDFPCAILNDRPRFGYSHVQATLAAGGFGAVGPTGVVI